MITQSKVLVDRKKSRLATVASASYENLTLEQPAVDEVSAPNTAVDHGPPEPLEPWTEASSSNSSPLLDHPETSQETAAPSPLLEELGSELSELTDDEPARRLWASENSVREPTPPIPVEVGGFLPGGTLGE